MKTSVLKTKFGECVITEEQIRTAMRKFDSEHRSTESDAGKRYAIEEAGQHYPPKRILQLATGVELAEFYGGRQSNDVFRNLGFRVANLHPEDRRKIPEEEAQLNLPPPELNHLLEELFAKTWSHLHDNTWSHLNNDYSKLPDRPGVYVLAYSDQELAQRRVQEDEIYYVGVSHRGVLSRLKQFVKGLEDGGHHSGAKRFFRSKAKKMPYSQLISRETFFVASATVPCTYVKKDRTCLDLRKLGVVAALEWYVLAHIKEKIGREPELNKK